MGQGQSTVLEVHGSIREDRYDRQRQGQKSSFPLSETGSAPFRGDRSAILQGHTKLRRESMSTVFIPGHDSARVREGSSHRSTSLLPFYSSSLTRLFLALSLPSALRSLNTFAA